MAISLDGTVKDPAVQRNLDILARVTPIGPEDIQDGAVGTDQLAANAATKLYTTTATTSGPTTASTASPASAVIPEMTITADFGGNPIEVRFNGEFQQSGANSNQIEIFDAGSAVATTARVVTFPGASSSSIMTVVHAYTPAAGSRAIEIRWRVNAGTATAITTRRQLSILELRR